MVAKINPRIFDDLIQEGTDDITVGQLPPDEIADLKCSTIKDAMKLIEGVKYLVRNWIPFSMVTGLVAEPGVGKSAFALWLARTIMTGGDWFNGTKGPAKPRRVLWCPTENDMAITIDRINKWSVPQSWFKLPFDHDPLRSIDLTSAVDLERIEVLINRYKPLAVFVDSLRGGHDRDENCSRVGKIVKNLSEIAERTHAAILVVHHTRKLKPGEEITANDTRGSNAIVANFRSLIGFDRPDPKSDWVRFRLLKENLGVAPKPMGMLVTDKGLRFGSVPEKAKKNTERQRAIDFLRERMQPDKWYSAKEILEEGAEVFVLSRNAIQRAQDDLGIVGRDYVRKNEGVWEWRRPS